MSFDPTAHLSKCPSRCYSVGLVFGSGAESRPELGQEVELTGARYVADLSLGIFTIGAEATFPSVEALCDFVQVHWTALTAGIQACWIDPQLALHQQLDKLGGAEPLDQWKLKAISPLHGILEDRRIETWFQPVFADDQLDLWGYECLVRGIGEDGGLIDPGTLFRWAHEDHLLALLDRVCREKHIENAAKVENNDDLTFLINFLPTVIDDPEACLQSTFEAARTSGLHPSQVIFEVVETERVEDHEMLALTLEAYRSAGFRVALDDLGAGHAGLTILGEILPDLIKIDRQLVSRSTTSASYRTICKSIVDLGRNMGKMVLAEGVETMEELEFFRSIGTDLYQGYLLGKPSAVPATTPNVATSSVGGEQEAA